MDVIIVLRGSFCLELRKVFFFWGFGTPLLRTLSTKGVCFKGQIRATRALNMPREKETSVNIDQPHA